MQCSSIILLCHTHICCPPTKKHLVVFNPANMTPVMTPSSDSMMCVGAEMFSSSLSGKKKKKKTRKNLLHPPIVWVQLSPLTVVNGIHPQTPELVLHDHTFHFIAAIWAIWTFTSILNRSMRRALVQLGVFGVIAEEGFIQTPVTTSWGAILHTEAEKLQAS